MSETLMVVLPQFCPVAPMKTFFAIRYSLLEQLFREITVSDCRSV
jgi:hypothetical protein